jgi:hypothetical protein
LAAIQIASAETSRNNLWKDLVEDLKNRRKKSKCFTKVKKALLDRNIWDKISREGAEVVSTR